jgi:beta-glucosidase
MLKGELGFEGFLISDWEAISQLPGNSYDQVVRAINAGVDMHMGPEWQTFYTQLQQAVKNGSVPMSRIDDAVGRILRAKFTLGLFEHPLTDPEAFERIGSPEHRAVAREAVRQSLVLLTNENQALPIAKDAPLIFVAGQAAQDIGLQAGGWTITWQGQEGKIMPGTTIWQGIQALAGSGRRWLRSLALFTRRRTQRASCQPMWASWLWPRSPMRKASAMKPIPNSRR